MKKQNRFIKALIVLFLSFSIILGYIPQVFALKGEETNIPLEKVINDTASLMYKDTPNPNVGSIGGEWTILSLVRSEYNIPQSYYDNYYNNVVKTLKECNGNLNNVKYTEYSRVILGLTSIGKDVKNVGGYNLLEKLADYEKVIKQGINGPIFALIALDANNYDIPTVEKGKVQTTREKLIDFILEKEITDKDGNVGGWALGGNTPDPDITAMALQALAKYKDEEKIKSYIDRAINVLSKIQLPTGGYGSWNTANSESTAQVIVALTSLGINPAKDERFIKSENKCTISAIMDFYVEGGGFKHVLDGPQNGMATDQAMYALVAYDRFKNRKTSLYDMTDIFKKKDESGEYPIDSPKDQNDNKNNLNQNSNIKNMQSGNQAHRNDKKVEYNNEAEEKNDKKKVKTTPKVIVEVLYKGEKNSLIPENKQAVAIQFTNEKATPQILFNNVELYYSNELSNKNESATYIALFDKKITSKILNDITKYTFNRNITSENITFGDVNGDNVINAQDALNTVSVILDKIDLSNDKEILAINNNGDSKLDTLDINGIMERYLKEKQCNIINKM